MSRPGRMRPGAPEIARWCDQHHRYECVHQRTKGRGQCHGSRVAGTDSCDIHAGKTRERAKAEGQARITAWSALAGGQTISHDEAMLALLTVSWLRWHYYADLLRRQVEGQARVGEPGTSGTGGLVGGRFSASAAAGGVYATGEAPRALVEIEERERDRCARYAKWAHEMGIAERETALAERLGGVIQSGFAYVIEQLGLVNDPRVAEVVPLAIRRMGQLMGTEDTG